MTQKTQEKILVTSALPYANGPIHFGHIAGAYLPADIFVRYHRLKGSDIIYICGTDEHGVAITMSAKEEGLSPMELASKYHNVHKEFFNNLHIEFDNFSRTTEKHHYKLAQEIFLEVLKNDYIENSEMTQLYCPNCKQFLADRYVIGICPYCDSKARGDECTGCGKWLEPKELKEPKCITCGTKPEIRSTYHWFLQLQKFAKPLSEWLETKTYWKENVTNFVKNMLKDLRERPITRDMEWGIPIPLDDEMAKGKVFYVWFDAPIGYISSSIEWAEKIGEPERWKDYWFDENTKLIHFIGKDNIPFHCIVWPSVLMGYNENVDEKYILPYDVPANEFYNFEGRKFSKSEGWYIDNDDFFEKYTTDMIRYTIASNAPETKDSEFQWKDFQARVAELADTFGNFIHRTLQFTKRYFDNKVPEANNLNEIDKQMLKNIIETREKIAAHLEKYEVRRAIFEFMELNRLANRYFDEKMPWSTRKTDIGNCANTLYVCLNVVASIGILAYPFMPTTASKIWKMINKTEAIKTYSWSDAGTILLKAGDELGKAEILFKKIENSQIEMEISKLHKANADKEIKKPKMELQALKEQIDYEHFAQIDMRIGEILECEKIAKSKKLLKLQVDIGLEKRQLVAGMSEYYKPEELIGKLVVVLVNLKPVKLMGVESNGIVLAADDGRPYILQAEGDVEIGAIIR